MWLLRCPSKQGTNHGESESESEPAIRRLPHTHKEPRTSQELGPWMADATIEIEGNTKDGRAAAVVVGVVQAWVDQKLGKSKILRGFRCPI